MYVHIPFCSRRCDYCAFATWTDRHHLMVGYAAACVSEVRRAVATGMAPATSVFFGGGTPSLLPAALLVGILDAVPRAAGAEVTVECNPDTVTPALLNAYVTAGVNRISLGVQSMATHVLVGLGREHDPAAVGRAAALVAASGVASWSVDLILGASGESEDDWGRTLDAVLALDPPHVSAYALTVEPGTPLSADNDRHPDDDDQATKYLAGDAALEASGRPWYEVSNWARPGHECRHNLLYWAQGSYRGFGCAAHSHDRVARRRWWNVRTPERYIDAVAAGAMVCGGDEVLSGSQQEEEALQLLLRTRSGVPAAALAGPEGHIDPVLDGLVEVVSSRGGDRAVLTPRGRLLANEVSIRLRRSQCLTDV